MGVLKELLFAGEISGLLCLFYFFFLETNFVKKLMTFDYGNAFSLLFFFNFILLGSTSFGTECLFIAFGFKKSPS